MYDPEPVYKKNSEIASGLLFAVFFTDFLLLNRI